jgi:CheY-like chemotaxis protein
LGKNLEKYDLACTYLKSGQIVAAHNLFMSLAQKEKKNHGVKAGLYLILASECKLRQGKDGKEELSEAGKLYLKLAKTNFSDANYAYQCAARCFLRTGKYKEAMSALDAAKKHSPIMIEEKRPIVIVDDSPAILMRVKSFLEQLGYEDIKTATDGKSAVNLILRLIKIPSNPIVLLDMDLPGLKGDVVARRLLESKPSLTIILITAEEKTTPRVTKIIGFGSAAFIQKPFTINELKNALDTAKLSEVK